MLRVSIVEHPTMVVRQTVPTAIATMMPITGTGCVVLFRLAVPADLELSQHGRAFDSLHVILTGYGTAHRYCLGRMSLREAVRLVATLCR